MNAHMDIDLKKSVALVIISAIIFGIYLLAKLNIENADSAQSTYKNVDIRMERTACFGTCPVYKLSIDERGDVAYEGKRFVEVTGVKTSQIHRQQVERLVDEFIASGFFEMENEYTGNVTDLPTTITSINIDGRQKTVKNYYGAPDALRELEDEIDKTANVRIWIGDCRKDGTCPEPN